MPTSLRSIKFLPIKDFLVKQEDKVEMTGNRFHILWNSHPFRENAHSFRRSPSAGRKLLIGKKIMGCDKSAHLPISEMGFLSGLRKGVLTSFLIRNYQTICH
ncbi:hypothetical protein TNIN_458661 [Trichonephila inaurata madagascariensis]|uniref:Uncharacterized protein n=1 Tax=Trichonephila inaurata madagascariensis TaxID=2747483 RepID=A0A8X7C683_9ARAC|nr:hypothetical protein TNIN_458661 [Trichonephila inaurata madagascariensis]